MRVWERERVGQSHRISETLSLSQWPLGHYDHAFMGRLCVYGKEPEGGSCEGWKSGLLFVALNLSRLALCGFGWFPTFILKPPLFGCPFLVVIVCGCFDVWWVVVVGGGWVVAGLVNP